MTLSRYEVIIKDSANKDIEDIMTYIIENFKSFYIAENLLKKIRNKIMILQESPQTFQTLYNYKYKNREYKRIIVENYSIVYYILKEQKKVFIVHIYYNKRKVFNF